MPRTPTPTQKKALPPPEVAAAQFRETNAFLNLVRQSIARQGVGHLEAVELGLRAALFKDARTLLQTLYQDPDLQVPDDASRPGEQAHPDRPKTMQTLFGPLELRRTYYYHAATHTGRAPLDAALGLTGSFSPALVRLSARAAAKEGYESASDDLRAQAGVALDGRQIQRLVNLAAPAVAAQLAAGPPASPKPIPVMYVEVDGTGVPLVAAEPAGRAGKQADGSARTREVKLDAIFTQTQTDADGLPVRDHAATTYVGGFESAPDFGLRVRVEGHVQALVRAVLDAPALPVGPQPLRGGEFFRAQVGDKAHGFILAARALAREPGGWRGEGEADVLSCGGAAVHRHFKEGDGVRDWKTLGIGKGAGTATGSTPTLARSPRSRMTRW